MGENRVENRLEKYLELCRRLSGGGKRRSYVSISSIYIHICIYRVSRVIIRVEVASLLAKD